MEARNEEAAGLTIPDAPPATGLFPQDINIEEIRKAIHGAQAFFFCYRKYKDLNINTAGRTR